MPLTKINKLMAVVTFRREHFMNSVFVNPDAFLEISAHLFLPYVSNLLIMNEITFQCFFKLSKTGAAIVNTISSININKKHAYLV